MSHVWVLQSRFVNIVCSPDWLEYDGECFHPVEGEELPSGCPVPSSDAGDYPWDESELYRFLLDEYEFQGGRCAIETWQNVEVFRDEEQARDYAQRHAYRYREGWRVVSSRLHGACANSELLELGRRHGGGR